MKKSLSPYTKKELRIIRWGYFYKWSPLLIIPIFLIEAALPAFLPIINKTAFVLMLSITCFVYGSYSILGTILEFKHILVGLQLSKHKHYRNKTFNPRVGWTNKYKFEAVAIGIAWFLFGAMLLIAYFK